MAAATSFLTCLLHEHMVAAPKDDSLASSNSQLLNRQSILCVSTGFRQSKIQSNLLGIENTATSSFSIGKKFELDDVLEAQQFDREILGDIFQVAREMEKIKKNSSGSQILKSYLMATLFYEPSTRTRLSFESAMKRLGGEVLTTENAKEFSSAAKGETLEGKLFCFVFFYR